VDFFDQYDRTLTPEEKEMLRRAKEFCSSEFQRGQERL